MAYKKIGETPLVCLERIRSMYGISGDIPMTYAGRLDPLACGALIILTGDDCKQKDSFNKLDKTYEAQFFLGISTDTGDIFGIPHMVMCDSPLYSNETITNKISALVYDLKNKKEQEYPIFSSKKVQGKPLFMYGLQNEAVELPKRSIVIHEIKAHIGATILAKDTLNDIEFLNATLGEGFRGKEILISWNNILSSKTRSDFLSIELMCRVSSGTYIRSFTHEIYTILGIPASLYRLYRSSVGSFNAPQAEDESYVIP